MSTIKVNNITVRSGCTMTLGESGKTITIPSGATITNSGTQTGFGRTGAVDWVTTVKTGTFTAVNGEGYFVNTTSGTSTVNLPAGTAGSIVAIKDYASKFATNNCTVTPNGSQKINGVAASATLSTNDISITFVYIDDTKGWRVVQDSTSSVSGSALITATGGTVSTVCTNFKVHVFNSPGTFCISGGGGDLAKVDYIVVGGGAGGGRAAGGGGGAGGYRESKTSAVSGCFTASPLASSTPLGPFSPGGIPVTVGAGGSAPGNPPNDGGTGSVSTFSTITSAGGGYGGGRGDPGNPGGSGGGWGGDSGHHDDPGTGNVPPVSPPQGNSGGGPSQNLSSITCAGSGGGGAGGAAPNWPGTRGAGSPGGNGTTSHMTGSPVVRAGGGGGAGCSNGPNSGGSAGPGGAGAGGNSSSNGGNGTANTGGGAGGSRACGGAGGSGVVIIRYKFQ